MTVEEVTRIVRGRLVGDPGEFTFEGVSLDSRTTAPGELFFAIPGEKFDGHRFVAQAFARGAVAAVVHAPRLPCGFQAPGPMIAVQDVVTALGDLASEMRRQHRLQVVGITGSVGKTTTKDLTATVLAQKYQVLRNEGNFNNEIGVPLTLLQLTPEHEALVVEMAMRGREQIRYLARMSRPQIGLITNIGVSHLELLGSQEAIADAKAELLEELPSDGVGVLNRDDPFFPRLKERAPDVVTFGRDPESDVSGVVLLEGDEGSGRLRRGSGLWALGSEPGTGRKGTAPSLPSQAQSPEPRAQSPRAKRGKARVAPSPSRAKAPSLHLRLWSQRFGVEPFEAWLQSLGRHQLYNALAATAIGLCLGVSPDGIAEGLSQASVSHWRMELMRTGSGALVLNDAYNASPASMAAALETLADQQEPGRRLAVLGDMRELGPLTEEAHREVGRRVVECGVARLITVGEFGQEIAAGAAAAGMPETWIHRCGGNAEAVEHLRSEMRAGDVVLVKGSRALQMEEIVRGIAGC